MGGLLARYANWLHLRWPAGTVERLPVVDADGRSNLPGVFIAGDLTGVPLLKFSLDTGARCARICADELRRARGSNSAASQGAIDVAIIGGGVAGMAAAVECAKQGLTYRVIEAVQPFSTIANFPARKPIYTYPKAMTPAGDLQVGAESKEELFDELRRQTAGFGITTVPGNASHIERQGAALRVMLKEGEPISARRVIVAIGRSGNFRRLGVPGEDLAKVSNRLHDPKAFTGQAVLVVGGGDSALEAAISLCEAGAQVTLSYRGTEFNRAKSENAARITALAASRAVALRLGSQVTGITADAVELTGKGQLRERLENPQVFTLIGREPPLDFFRRSGLAIRGERNLRTIVALSAFTLAITLLYGWKNFGWLGGALNPARWLSGLAKRLADPTSLGHVLVQSASTPGFWVTLAYSAAVVGFGIDRIRRRRTPYVTLQTSTLMAIQCLPLFILPEIVLPWLGANELIPQTVRDHLFPGDQYWKAYGFVLAWPLMAWNVFTREPNSWWLVIGFVQTFVIIPLLVWKWGKGAYCGWICSCGALAETMGDRHREKMPHGEKWNRLNLVGQVVLATAFIILALHVVSWCAPATVDPGWLEAVMMKGYWKHAVDFFLAGALGTGLYFWYSGRVWCRFACPLAALMHIYARFSRFRIIADKKKCISCNACTTVCHQGIDVMNFANRGEAMADPECVRCSACVQTCPTGVLQFGEVDGRGETVRVDSLAASPVLMRERATF